MQEDEMPPLRLLSPYPESETPAKSPDTPQNELNCGRTTVGRPPEESLAQNRGSHKRVGTHNRFVPWVNLYQNNDPTLHYAYALYRV